jgi:hypothetical protein
MLVKFRRHALASVSLLFAIVAPLLSCSTSNGLLRVGHESITHEDVLYAQKTARCYGDTLSVTESIVAKLTSDLLEYEVLRSAFNETPPDSILRAKADVISQTTRDSAVLECILNIGDMDRYLRLVVRPTLVNPRLHSRYAMDSAMHTAARDTIQRIFDRLRTDPSKFMQERLDTLRIPKASQLGVDPFVANVISKLELGRLWPQIIETESDFRIVMLHGRSDSLYIVLMTRAMKQPFDTWFRSYVTERMPVEFMDRSLEASMRRRYPQLWWLSR